MDDRRFDALTRTIAGQAWTRRRALQGVVGGALAAVLTRVGLEEADAACVKPGKRGCRGPHPRPCCAGAKCQGGNKIRPGRCVCKAGRTKCGPACVSTKTNTQHCGGCNKPCGAGRTCLSGICTGGGSGGCPAGTTLCGSTCVNTQISSQHCGGCDMPCGADQTCSGGICGCPEGKTLCGTACVDTETSRQHCGGCNNACVAACTQGTCRPLDEGTCSQAYDICVAHPGVNVSCNQVNNQGECKCSKRLDGRPFCGLGMRCGCLSDADCVAGDACVECAGLCSDFGNKGCAAPCPVGP